MTCFFIISYDKYDFFNPKVDAVQFLNHMTSDGLRWWCVFSDTAQVWQWDISVSGRNISLPVSLAKI